MVTLFCKVGGFGISVQHVIDRQGDKDNKYGGLTTKGKIV
jgi:hypothetical protein